MIAVNTDHVKNEHLRYSVTRDAVSFIVSAETLVPLNNRQKQIVDYHTKSLISPQKYQSHHKQRYDMINCVSQRRLGTHDEQIEFDII